MITRETYIQQMEAQIDRWNNEIAFWRSRVPHPNFQQHLDALAANVQSVHQKLHHLKQSDNWEGARGEVEDGFSFLNRTLSALKKALRLEILVGILKKPSSLRSTLKAGWRAWATGNTTPKAGWRVWAIKNMTPKAGLKVWINGNKSPVMIVSSCEGSLEPVEGSADVITDVWLISF
jgi:hypothetical protein